MYYMIGNWINTIRLTIIGLCLLLPTLVHANITVSASVDKQTLTINDTLEYKLTIAGSSTDLAIEENFLNGFYIARRSSAQSYQLINGQFSASHIKTFVLRPKKEGRITIPPATIRNAGKSFKTQAINITVAAGSTNPAPAQNATATTPSAIKPPQKTQSKELFLVANSNKKTAYVGEEIIYKTHLFRRFSAIEKLLFQEPKITALTEKLKRDPQTYTQNHQGRNYYVQEIDKRALFSYQPGYIRIPPAISEVQISFFYENQVIESNPINIKILPLPDENKPKTFSGLVGEFTLEIDVDTSTLIENKPLAIRLKVTGGGNIKQLKELYVDSDPKFKIYKSDTTDHITYEQSVKGTRHFEYILVPKEAGNFQLPSFSINYFSPQSKTYKTLSTKRSAITVIASGEAAVIATAASNETKELRQDFRYIKENLLLNKKVKPLHKQWLAWILWFINVGFAGLLLTQYLLNIPIIKQNLHRLSLKPDKKAIKALKNLPHPLPNTQTNSIQSILLTYISSVIKRPAQALAQHELKDALKRHHVNSEALFDIFEQCNMLSYAPDAPNTITADELRTQAIKWIETSKGKSS